MKTEDLGKIRRGKSFSSFFNFPTPLFFPQQSFTCFPKTKEFSRKNTMVVGKRTVGETNKGVGKRKKGENGFLPSYFFPKSSVFTFFPSSQFSP